MMPLFLTCSQTHWTTFSLHHSSYGIERHRKVSTRRREELILLLFALWGPFPIYNNPVSCLLHFGQRREKPTKVNTDFTKSMSLSIKKTETTLERNCRVYIYIYEWQEVLRKYWLYTKLHKVI